MRDCFSWVLVEVFTPLKPGNMISAQGLLDHGTRETAQKKCSRQKENIRHMNHYYTQSSASLKQ